jgi:hypothetical protein
MTEIADRNNQCAPISHRSNRCWDPISSARSWAIAIGHARAYGEVGVRYTYTDPRIRNGHGSIRRLVYKRDSGSSSSPNSETRRPSGSRDLPQRVLFNSNVNHVANNLQPQSPHTPPPPLPHPPPISFRSPPPPRAPRFPHRYPLHLRYIGATAFAYPSPGVWCQY